MAKTQNIHGIRVTLNGSEPPIWRELAVPSDITLGELHEVIQIAMGWMNDHLHEFRLIDKSLKPTAQEIAKRRQQHAWDDEFLARMRGERVFVPTTDPMGEPMDEIDGEDENGVTLAEVCPKVKSKLIYEYDFGDGWEHTIEVRKIAEAEPGTKYPVCLGGQNACPLEDCGGIWGYNDILQAIADPKHERHEELLEWLGDDFDPAEFDLEDANANLADLRR